MSPPDASVWRLSVTDTRQYIFGKNVSVADSDSIWRLSVTDTRQYIFEKKMSVAPGQTPGPATDRARRQPSLEYLFPQPRY